MQQGKVKFYHEENGFGFIKNAEGEWFFHHSDIQSKGYKTLSEGQDVEFEITEGKKGPKACNVRAVAAKT